MAGDLHGKYPVVSYSDPARAVIAGRDNGAFAVADPRPTHGPNAHTNKMKVIDYREACVTVTGSDRVGSGALSVADPRLEEKPRYSNVFRVTAPDEPAPAVTSAKGSLAAVADPRPQGLGRPDHYGVLGWGQTSGTVTASAHGWDNGRFSVADPRPHGLQHKDANSFGNQAHYGVIGWEQHSGSVTAFGQADNGRWSVADRRVDLLPGLKEQLVCLIIALDGTWHRPFTTLELAALQSLYDPEDVLELEGRSDSAWRERIGNAVPSAAAEAIAGVMGTTLLLAMTGETFSLSNDSIWVRQLQIGLSVDLRGQVPA